MGIRAFNTEVERLEAALENCRIYAARHRNMPWAESIIRFCEDAGVTGSILRSGRPRSPFIHIKTCVAYETLGVARNCTNDRDGEALILYRKLVNPVAEIFAREVSEFAEKFDSARV